MNGLIAMPLSHAYNAARFAVEGLMEGLAPVMATFGVHVSEGRARAGTHSVLLEQGWQGRCA